MFIQTVLFGSVPSALRFNQYQPLSHSYSAMLAAYISPLRALNVRQQAQGIGNQNDALRDVPVAFLRVIGDVIPSILVHRAWVNEVLVQMVSKLKDVSFHCARHRDIVDQASGSQPTLADYHRRGEPTSNE